MNRLAAFATVALLPVLSPACAGIGANGQPVAINQEDVVLAFSRQDSIQHLIRRVSFNSGKTDVTFFVPVPTLPVVAEADPKIFNWARTFFPRAFPRGAAAPVGGGLGGSRQPKGVEVVQTDYVAGLKAQTVQINSLNAFRQFLVQNKLPSNNALVNWAGSYASKGMYIIAFQIDNKSQSDRVGQSAVRISFATENPYYPYREPAGSRPTPGRRWNCLVLADEPLDAFHQDYSRWRGVKVGTVPLEPDVQSQIKAQAGLDPESPNFSYATLFTDHQEAPRTPKDLLFQRTL